MARCSDQVAGNRNLAMNLSGDVVLYLGSRGSLTNYLPILAELKIRNR